MTLGTEVLSIYYICTLHDSIDIIVKTTAMTAVVKVGDFIAKALPDNIKIRDEEPFKGNKPFVIKRWRDTRSDIQFDHKDVKKEEMKNCPRSEWLWEKNVYGFFRLLYTFVIFYTLPFLTIFLPMWCVPTNECRDD